MLLSLSGITKLRFMYTMEDQTSATDTFANSTQTLATTLHSETSADF